MSVHKLDTIQSVKPSRPHLNVFKATKNCRRPSLCTSYRNWLLGMERLRTIDRENVFASRPSARNHAVVIMCALTSIEYVRSAIVG